MGVTLRHETGNIYRLDITGVLHEQDFRAVERSAAGEIDRVGRIRLLVTLTEFEGWDRGTTWRDLGFFVAHGEDIERIAVVGDDRWRDEALMFAAADLRRAAVAFFPGNLALARAWLSD